jgi:hypothetical protein
MFYRPIRWTLVTALVLMVVLSSSLSAAKAPTADTDATRQLIIRSTYQNLADYAAFSRSGLRFEISQPQNLLPAQLDEMLWTDLVTMPGGKVIDMLRNVRTNGVTGEARVSYDPTWRVAEENWLQAPEGRDLLTMRADAVLRTVSQKAQRSELSQVLAVTGYQVTAILGTQRRTYQAAFVWVPALEGTDAAFVVVDNITQGVEEAAREPLAPLTDLAFLFDTGRGPSPAPAPEATCSAWSNYTSDNTTYSGTGSHITGSHQRSSNMKITCSCTSTCRSTCSSLLTSGSCSDSGTPLDMCHKMASNYNGSTIVQDNGNVTAASCGAGYGCAQRPCLFCLCGLTVGVSVNGASVSFSAADASWTGHRAYTRTCAKCT